MGKQAGYTDGGSPFGFEDLEVYKAARTFRKRVFLLEREFDPPPPTYRYVYQRYYLSKSQELIVVREWWHPVAGKLQRNKTLHIC